MGKDTGLRDFCGGLILLKMIRNFRGISTFVPMKLLRKLLFPFALLYGGITALRNGLYNNGFLKSKAFDLPVICVGNLSTGGTGKTPMIELLVSYLKVKYGVAVLSRGYKRKTSGFLEVLPTSSVAAVGDEPLQFKTKFPDVTVAVCEDRKTGIEKLRKKADIILLDDAFQHRKVKPSFNILLTTYGNLYVNDWLLPAGNLREPREGARRADIIVVTKCPASLSARDMEQIRKRLHPQPYQEVYFSKIAYAPEIRNQSEAKPLSFLKGRKFLLVSGIANPKPLVGFLKDQNLEFGIKSFGDHHNFSTAEKENLKKHKLILTTEKDFMRLQDISREVELYYLPIGTQFLAGGEVAFKQQILAEAATSHA